MISDNRTKLVVIGGGTGLSSILRGLKHYTSNITAIVTVADDGGSSGLLRNDYGVLPPGDIRNCILALADTEPIMEKLMQYRFVDGSLEGQNFGNLLLTVMNNISGGFVNGIREISNVLAVTGTVLPVTLDDITLCAQLENGVEIHGESRIPIIQEKNKSKIKRMFTMPKEVNALPEAINAILDADIIILGPGSLYTSVMPNLIIKDIAEALINTTATIVYAVNIMTQKGETTNYNIINHIKAIDKHIGKSIISYVIVNNGDIDDMVLQRYAADGETPLYMDEVQRQKTGAKIVQADIVKIVDGFIRHDADKFADIVSELPVVKIWRGNRRK